MMLFRHSLVRFILGIISLSLSVGFIRSIYAQIQKEDLVSERRMRYEKELQRNAQLKKRLEEATSSAFVEKLAREKLGWVKENDTVILLDTTAISRQNTDGTSRAQSNWDAWWELFR